MKKTPIKTIEKEIRTACAGKPVETYNCNSCALGFTAQYFNIPRSHLFQLLPIHWQRTEGELWCFIYGFDGTETSLDNCISSIRRGSPSRRSQQAMFNLGVRLRDLLP